MHKVKWPARVARSCWLFQNRIAGAHCRGSPKTNGCRGESDTPFLQIGETKYGKPVLDRMLTYETPMAEALKIALISFSATMRSNLAVGLPVDIATIRSGVSDPHHPRATTDEVHALIRNSTYVDPPWGDREPGGQAKPGSWCGWTSNVHPTKT